ncbi:MAG: DUF3352 domain-containing protein [Planctomycetota bacterium]
MNSVRSALLGVLLLPVAALAAPESSFAELLPADTLAYLETNPLSAAEMKRAVAYKALAEPELRRVLDRMLDESGSFNRVAVPIGRSTLRAAMDIREAGIAFELAFREGKQSYSLKVRGKMAFACVGLSQDARRGVMPDLVAAFTVANDPAEAHKLVRALLRSLDREMGVERKRRPVRDWEHRGCTATSIRIGNAGVHVATVGKRIVIANLRDRLLDVIDRSLTKSASSLATTPRHKDALEQAMGSGTITSFLELDVQGALRQVAEANPRQFAGLVNQARMFGLGGLKGVTSTTRADGDGVAGTTSILLEGRRTGLARLFAKGPPAKFGCLEFAPQKTLYVAAGRFDGKGLFRILAETSQPAAQILGQLAVQFLGVNLYDDLVKRIGPEAALIVSSNEGLIPDIGLVFESDDPQRLQKTVLRMLSRAPWQKGTGVERTRLGGVDAHVVKVFHPRMSELPIAPTFGVVDGYFVVTLYPISFQRFVATKKGERPSIASNRDYAALRERVSDDALSLSYLDVRRTVAIAYDTIMPILQAMPQQEGSMPIYEFPEAHVFTKHLFGRIAWRVADDRGMHWHSYSSTDVGSMVLGLSAAAGGIAALTLPRKQEGETPPPPAQVANVKHAEVYLCEANVRRIRNQLRPLQRRGRPFPEKLDEVKGRWIDKRTLIVPGTNNEQYTYLGPKGKNGILLMGKPNGPRGHICVLTTELRVIRLSPTQLQAKLER